MTYYFFVTLVPAHISCLNFVSVFDVLRGQLKCDVTCAQTRFCLLAKRMSPFKSTGASVQSTTGSRVVKGTGYPPHSPISLSLPLLCVTVCHNISTGVYSVNKYLNQVGFSVPESETVC